mmetsp:Transcript_11649/g.16775  ORF Transcript_11649/g.16775 Transcript_11649/m.16775 type:complete len:696 (-) Transcript_11649:38-2125(-)
MSNARKLQTEIDRVMKKVEEGVESFDDIWEKVYSAEQQSQKEKHEMDLKKEIKKLQRNRDQIKSWISSSDVKDKDALIEARKLIETKMEQFKICEKETKTKTYSKEGLARADRLSPEEEAKLKTTSWISEVIDRLHQLVEERDVEIERLSAGKGKKTNKSLIDQYNQFNANHKFHISKLEGIMRLVNNDLLAAELVDDIKEELDYYIDAYDDEDYMQAYDEDMFYENLGLDELDVVNVDTVTQAPVSASAKNDDSSTEDKSSGNRSGGKNSKKASTAANVIPLTIGRARVTSDKVEKSTVAVTTPTKRTATTQPPTGNDNVSDSNSVGSSGGARRDISNGSSTGVPTFLPAPVPQQKVVSATAPSVGTSMAAILKRDGEAQQEKERQQKAAAAAATALQAEQQRQQQLLREQHARAAQQQEQQLRQQQQIQQRQQEQQQRQQQQQEAALRQQQQQQQEAVKRQMQEQQAREAAKQQQSRQQQEATNKLKKQQQEQLQQQQHTSSSGLDILSQGIRGLTLGLSDGNSPSNNIDASSKNTPVSPEQRPPGDTVSSSYLGALNDSFLYIPSALDSERQRSYTPRNPYPTPSSYPTTPSALFENPAIFEKLGTDCLFFIFYYSQGTYQQYLAARELKKQSWRFHKKYMTWFQRHEEPKVTTDEYEQGTYVYFDYETGWCQRLKQDFRFEYSFLEDSLII